MSEVRTRSDAVWWAWQFLRRNESYRAEWGDLINHIKWPEKYGEYPHDSFAAVIKENLLNPDHLHFVPTYQNCRKWGLVDWVNPDLENPDLERLPMFFSKCGPGDRRDASERVPGDTQGVGGPTAVFSFDKRRPLDSQIKAAKEFLKKAQAEYEEREGFSVTRARRAPKKWQLYLDVIDYRRVGKSWREIMALLYPKELELGLDPWESASRKDYEAGQKLVDGGYLDIPHMQILE